ncbi:hypothetical protein CUR86_12530 [Salinicola acroporae]|uniref:Uncharacterized protein n=1 Tax=Salinicola acroporae TaxID=1541440 RepID=A0ABT6I6V1_9GAMM|nr:hypothetical protein [Salinicola acroporae]
MAIVVSHSAAHCRRARGRLAALAAAGRAARPDRPAQPASGCDRFDPGRFRRKLEGRVRSPT